MRLAAKKSYLSEFRETWRDFEGTYRKVPLAVSLAVQDILTRYRGSVLGPWWITITMGALVLGIGVEYAALFHMEVRDLLPYIALGLVVWGFISSNISEGGEAFVSGGAILRQSSLPLPIFILRCVVRNIIVLGHNLVILLAVVLWFRIYPGLGVLWAIPGLILNVINLSWCGLAIALVSARFRDVPQIVAAVLQFIFFLSPVFWKPSGALMNSIVVKANPFYFSIQTIREPILHGVMPMGSFLALGLLSVVGWTFTILCYNQTRRRVVHYL